MGRLREIIKDYYSNNKIITTNQDSLKDRYLGPFLLMRTYKSTVTIYYQGAYDRLIITKDWFDLFESIDNFSGDLILGVAEPSDSLEKFIYLFFKLTRGIRIGFSYNPDNAARLLIDELINLKTTEFVNFTKELTNYNLNAWRYERIDNIIEI